MHIYTYSYSYIVAAWGTFSQRTDNVTVPNINQNQQCKAKKQSKDTLNEIKQILNEIKHIQLISVMSRISLTPNKMKHKSKNQKKQKDPSPLFLRDMSKPAK